MKFPSKLIRLRLDEDHQPPREWLLIPYGPYETSKGTFVLTEESALKIMANYREHCKANERGMMFDYEHMSLAENPGPHGAPAAGWYDLELRGDGLWAVNIKWTPKAAHMLSTGEYRHISPAFDIDHDTNEIIELVNVAMTNLPATHQARPLVAASKSKKSSKKSKKSKENCMADDKKAPAQEEMSLNGQDVNTMAVDSSDSAISSKISSSSSSSSDSSSSSSEMSMSNDEMDIAVSNDEASENGNKSQNAMDLIGFQLSKRQAKILTTHEKLMTDVKKEKYLIEKERKEIHKLRADMESSAKKELIKLGKREGKLTPAQIQYFDRRSLRDLKEYLKIATKHAASEELTAPNPNEVNMPDVVASNISRLVQPDSLTKEDLEVIRLTSSGTEKDKKDFLEMKKIVSSDLISTKQHTTTSATFNFTNREGKSGAYQGSGLQCVAMKGEFEAIVLKDSELTKYLPIGVGISGLVTLKYDGPSGR